MTLVEPTPETEASQPETPTEAPTDAEIDRAYNDLIERVLGEEAVKADRPLREFLDDTVVGGVTVVPDSFDLGQFDPTPVADEDPMTRARRTLASIRRSFEEIPVDDSE